MPQRAEIPTWSESDRDRVEHELSLRELAAREVGGLAVHLYWHRRSNSLSCALIDITARQTYVFPVANDRALDAFYHPYPYAIREGLVIQTSKED